MTDPTDAEIEAMAEKLWDVWRTGNAGMLWRGTPWFDLVYVQARQDQIGPPASLADTFRAMARVALKDVAGD